MTPAICFSRCCYANVIDVFENYDGNHGVERHRWVASHCNECGKATDPIGLHEAVGVLLNKVRDLEREMETKR